MLKKICALLLSVVMMGSIMCPASATDIQNGSEKDEMNIVYFTSFSEMDNKRESVDTVVLTEDQMLQLGESVKDIFKYTQMVYVMTSKSVSDILDACKITASIQSDDENPNKYATIIELNENGEYTFNNISALVCETESGEVNALRSASVRTEKTMSQLVEDGLDAYINTKSSQMNNNSRTQPAGFYSWATDSAVLYDGSGGRIGTMGYTAYWYKVVKSGANRIFDVVCIATFAPDPNYACAKMTVYLGTPFNNHEILEAANIISTGQTYTHDLSLTKGKSGVSGTVGTSWSYTVDAQTVTKSFDMTTNDRTWIFEPKKAGAGDAWIEEPGLRMCSTQTRCHTTVTISCPKIGLFGIVTNNNSISTNWFFNWD